MANDDRVAELEKTLAVVNATKQINKANEALRHKLNAANIPYIPSENPKALR